MQLSALLDLVKQWSSVWHYCWVSLLHTLCLNSLSVQPVKLSLSHRKKIPENIAAVWNMQSDIWNMQSDIIFQLFNVYQVDVCTSFPFWKRRGKKVFLYMYSLWRVEKTLKQSLWWNSFPLKETLWILWS